MIESTGGTGRAGRTDGTGGGGSGGGSRGSRAARRNRTGPPRTALLAVASAVTASNVYLNQPLLGAAARDLHVPMSSLGAVPTATQLGYALGIGLIVPAGDSHDRRRLIIGLGAAGTLALAGSALAPSAAWLIAASFVLGLLSPLPQLLVPLAVSAAGEQGRGRVVGVLQGGLLVGVLAARTYSGSLAELSGWRSVYCCSAALTAVLTVVLLRALPAVPPPAKARYRTTLASLPRLFAAEPMVRRVTLSGALVGMSFGAFWTAMAFLLEQHYHYGSGAVGLFGLVAAASALVSPCAGRLADRSGPRAALAATIAVVIAGWCAALPGQDRLGWLIAAVVVVDIGTWGNQVVAQTMLFTLPGTVHSRLGTLWFTLRFAGIALGSLVGTAAWNGGGWPAVAEFGGCAAAAGLLLGVAPDHRHGVRAGRRAGRAAPPVGVPSGRTSPVANRPRR